MNRSIISISSTGSNRTRGKMFRAVSAALFGALVLAGCGGGDDSPTGPKDNLGLTGAGVVWVSDLVPNIGLVFTSNGKFYPATFDGSVWLTVEAGSGTWSGSTLKYDIAPDVEYAITVTNNQLDITFNGTSTGTTYTKATGKTITGPGASGGDPGTGGGNIVNGAGDAWVQCETEGDMEICGGMAFRGGKVYMVMSMAGLWFQEEVGTYATSGSSITVTFPGEDSETGSYAVSGNTLTLTYSDGAEVFTKRTGLTFASLCEFLVGLGEYSSVSECRADIMASPPLAKRPSGLSKKLPEFLSKK